MKHLNLSPEQVEIINEKHVYSVDKWFRMFAGISSNLISVKNGIAVLEIKIHSGWEKTNEVTAKQFIETWSKFNNDLKNLDGWEVRIYTSEKIAGFVISPNEVDSEDTKKKCDLYNAKAERSLEYLYRVLTVREKYPKIILSGELNRYFIEFPVKTKINHSGHFYIRNRENYIIFNKNQSENIFIIPNHTDDYLLFTESNDAERTEVKFIKASTSSMCFVYRGTTVYLINATREGIARIFWNDYMQYPYREKIYIKTINV